MLKEDEEEFVEFVMRDSNVTILRSRSPEPRPIVTSHLPEPPERWWWNVYFWNREFPLDVYCWRQIMGGPEMGMWSLRGQSPVIEFTRSIPRESGELSRGRLFTDHTEPAFLEWYDYVASGIRRKFERVRKVGHIWLYAGPNAYRWHTKGGVLANR